MPSLRTFSLLKPEEMGALLNLTAFTCKKEKLKPYSFKLDFVHRPKGFTTIDSPLVGGNLFVWKTLLGTPFVGNARGKILFLEEIQENAPRMNRMLHHLEQAGGLKGVKAIVLGDFLDCPDTVAKSLPSIPENVSAEYLRHPPQELLKPIRALYPPHEALDYIFRSLGERTQIAVLKGVPAGHGPNYHPLFLGKKHQLKTTGELKLTT